MCRNFLLTAAMLCMAFIAKTQHHISGKIMTRDGSPASNVNIEIVEIKKFTISDSNGIFTIKNISAGNYHVVASFTGLQTQRKFITVKDDETVSIDFVLTENASELKEVIINSKRGLNNQVVSLGKVAIDPMDLPQSITVVGQSAIRDQQSQRLSDIIKNVNGVYLSTTRASTQESFSARGYGFSSSNMFKNGSRVNTGAMPEVSSLEKVEVLKGSAAILYGNVAPGGVINMVTKQPKFFNGGEISLRAGSYGLIKPAFDVFGPLSSKVAFRVNGTYEKADSYRDKVESERFYINPSMLFKLGQHTDLLVQGDYLNTNFTPDFGIGSLADTAIANVPRSRFVGTDWQYNKAQQTTATASLKHQLNNKWSLSASASYQLFKRDYYSVERIQAKANGNWNRPLGRILSQEDYYIGSVDLIGKIKTGKIEHTLLTGIDADRYNTGNYTFDVTGKIYDTFNILNPGKYIQRTDIPVATQVTKTQTPINRFGAYIQDLISISSKFKVLAGVRWSMQKALPVTTNYLLKDSTGKKEGTSVDAFSPRVGLVYKPTDNLSVFTSYSNSFSVNTGTDILGGALPASIIDQYELGIKNEFFKGKLSANFTIYRIVNNNLAQTARFTQNGLDNSNTSIKELVGQTTSDGFEADISSSPLRGLNILAGYSYNNMRYTNIEPLKGKFIEGERLVNTPQSTANASVFYIIQKGKLKGLKVGAGGFYIGNRFGGWNNTRPADNQLPLATRLIPVGDFTTADISAGYTFKRISVMAKISNLFNTYNYYVHENYSINPIAPRQFVSTLSVKL